MIYRLAEKSKRFVCGMMVARQVNGKSLTRRAVIDVLRSARIKISHVEKNEISEFLVEKLLDEEFEEGSSNLLLYSAQKDEINEGELATPRTRTS